LEEEVKEQRKFQKRRHPWLNWHKRC